MPGKKRRLPSGRLLRRRIIALLIALLAATVGWIFGTRGGSADGVLPDKTPTPKERAFESANGSTATVIHAPFAAGGQAPSNMGAGPNSESESTLVASPSHGLLHGRVFDEEGLPACEARVHLLSEGPWNTVPELIASTTPDQHGVYRFFVPPPASGMVRVLCKTAGQSVTISPALTLAPFGVVDLPDNRLTQLKPIVVQLNPNASESIRWLLRPATSAGGASPPPFPTDETSRAVLSAEMKDCILPNGTLGPGETTTIHVASPEAWEIVSFSEGKVARVTQIDDVTEQKLSALLPFATSTLHVTGTEHSWALLTGGQPPLASSVRAGEACEIPTSLLTDPDATLCLQSGSIMKLGPLLAGRNLELPLQGEVEVEGSGDDPCGVVRVQESEVLSARRRLLQGRMRRWSGKPGKFLLEPGTWVAETWRSGVPHRKSAPFLLAAGSHLTVQTSEAIKLPMLSGRVVDSLSGKPLPHATLAILRGTVALDPDHWPQAAQSTGAGEFQMVRPADGRGTLLVKSPQHQPKQLSLESLKDGAEPVVRLQAGGALEVRVRDSNGLPQAGLRVAAIAQGRLGRVVLAGTNKKGVARLDPIAPGPHLLLLVSGDCSFPLDSPQWLLGPSGARHLKIQERGRLSRLEWKLPSTSAHVLNVRLSAEVSSCHLQVKPVGASEVPGLWVDLNWEDVRSGPLTTPGLVPGHYRALATSGDFVSIVDFWVRLEDDDPDIVFEFRKRN